MVEFMCGSAPGGQLLSKICRRGCWKHFGVDNASEAALRQLSGFRELQTFKESRFRRADLDQWVLRDLSVALRNIFGIGLQDVTDFILYFPCGWLGHTAPIFAAQTQETGLRRTRSGLLIESLASSIWTCVTSIVST